MMWRRALGTALCCAVLGAPGCTSSEDQFCGSLRDDYRLDELVTAVETRDQQGITDGLAALRDLQDVAPAAVHDDLRTVIDALESAVRAVTSAPGPDGEDLPVDLMLLREQLGAIGEPAQHVADYADRNCGLKLNP